MAAEGKKGDEAEAAAAAAGVAEARARSGSLPLFFSLAAASPFIFSRLPKGDACGADQRKETKHTTGTIKNERTQPNISVRPIGHSHASKIGSQHCKNK